MGCFLMQQYSHIQSPFVIYVHCEQELLAHSYASKLVTEIPFWIQLQADGLLQTSESNSTHISIYVNDRMTKGLFLNSWYLLI